MAGICVEKVGSVQIFLQDDGTYDGLITQLVNTSPIPTRINLLATSQ
jgi:hypothetical protein